MAGCKNRVTGKGKTSRSDLSLSSKYHLLFAGIRDPGKMSEHTPYEEYVRSLCSMLFNLTKQTERQPRAAGTQGDT